MSKPLDVNIVEPSQKDLLLQAVTDLEKFASNLKEMDDQHQVKVGFRLQDKLDWISSVIEENIL